MDKEMFWKLIDQSRKGVKSTDEQIEKLLGLVSKLDPPAILGFGRCFDECVAEAYRWDLWAVAYIVNGGCSDDGFEYYLGWLIAQGRRRFEAALKDPERAVDEVEPGEEIECEDMLGIASTAYEATTGKDDFWLLRPARKLTIQGTEWNEDEVFELYPKLAQKFGYSVEGEDIDDD